MNVFRKIYSFFQRKKLEIEMTEEMRHHVELQTELNRKTGMNPEEARYAALRQFGNVAVIQEQVREGRGWVWLEQLFQDLAYAVRGLAKSSGFTLTALLTLALGIGATTAIFSVVDGVLLKPLAYREPQRLVTLLHHGKFPVSPADFLDWRRESRSFSAMAAAESWRAALLNPDHTEIIPSIRLDEGMFNVLGVAPLLGRTFQRSDFQPGSERVAVLSHRFWIRHFGPETDVLGRKLTLDGETFSVVGVMPANFNFAPFWAAGAEIAAPLNLSSRSLERDSNSLRVFARLKTGVTRATAQTEMNGICRRLELAYPKTNTRRTVQIDSLLDKTVGNVRDSLEMLIGAVFFVLLAACVNVANLQLARSSTRQKEMAVRVALGASRFRIVRQLLAESVLLATGGAALGLLVGYVFLNAIRLSLLGDVGASPDHMPRLSDITFDSTTLTFTLTIASLTVLFFGVLPAFQGAASAERDVLQELGRGAMAGRKSRRLRRGLVVAEIALALITLTGAGLLIRSFSRLTSLVPGFDARNVLSMVVSLQGQPELVGTKREAFHRTIVEKISALPGVISVSEINQLPLASDLWVSGLKIEGQPRSKPGDRVVAVYRVIRPRYFQTMGVAVLRGRDFDVRDAPIAPGVVIINEKLARAYWPDESPLGRRIAVNDLDEKPNWLTIVGVVNDVRQKEWTREPENEIYLPFLQTPLFSDAGGPYSSMTVVAKTAVDPVALLEPVRNVIQSVNPSVPVSNMSSLDQMVDDALWRPRFNMKLTGIFAMLALLLASIGLYGIIAYSVGQRTREIGIRLALGARPANVLLLILGEGMQLAGLGLLFGLVGAFSLTRLIASQLFGVEPTDPGTFAAILSLLLLVAAIACWLPARRAATVDPMVALRAE